MVFRAPPPSICRIIFDSFYWGSLQTHPTTGFHRGGSRRTAVLPAGASAGGLALTVRAPPPTPPSGRPCLDGAGASPPSRAPWLAIPPKIYLIVLFLTNLLKRLPPLPPTSQKVDCRRCGCDSGDDFWRPWLTRGAPCKAFVDLECTGLARAAKVGYLRLLCRLEH